MKIIVVGVIKKVVIMDFLIQELEFYIEMVINVNIVKIKEKTAN